MKAKAKKQVKVEGEMLVNFVLDETGSMGVVRDTTISGFNEYVETLAEKSNKLKGGNCGYDRNS